MLTLCRICSCPPTRARAATTYTLSAEGERFLREASRTLPQPFRAPPELARMVVKERQESERRREAMAQASLAPVGESFWLLTFLKRCGARSESLSNIHCLWRIVTLYEERHRSRNGGARPWRRRRWRPWSAMSIVCTMYINSKST
jgi:hypothetical protein